MYSSMYLEKMDRIWLIQLTTSIFVYVLQDSAFHSTPSLVTTFSVTFMET